MIRVERGRRTLNIRRNRGASRVVPFGELFGVLHDGLRDGQLGVPDWEAEGEARFLTFSGCVVAGETVGHGVGAAD